MEKPRGFLGGVLFCFVLIFSIAFVQSSAWTKNPPSITSSNTSVPDLCSITASYHTRKAINILYLSFRF